MTTIWALDHDEQWAGDCYPSIFDEECVKPGAGRWGIPGTPLSIAVERYQPNAGDGVRWTVVAYFNADPFDRLSHMIQTSFDGLAHCADTLHLMGAAIVLACGNTVGES